MSPDTFIPPELVASFRRLDAVGAADSFFAFIYPKRAAGWFNCACLCDVHAAWRRLFLVFSETD